MILRLVVDFRASSLSNIEGKGVLIMFNEGLDLGSIFLGTLGSRFRMLRVLVAQRGSADRRTEGISNR
jgi:hypothetical protein